MLRAHSDDAHDYNTMKLDEARFSTMLFSGGRRAAYHGAASAKGSIVTTSEAKEYYTAEQACEVLGVKLATLYSYVNRGLLTSYRQNIRRQRLYRRSEVDALLEISPAGREQAEIPLADTWISEH
jgi:excisionase family DNA binding protein